MSIRIDKSLFTPEELNQYNALIAKATVEDDGDGKNPGNDGGQPNNPVEKSADPVLTAALERMANIEKSMEMQKYTEIAKKYAPLGEKEDELAETLYNMAKSNEANYNAYIGVLDKSLEMVEKSGIFNEIGKSAGGATSGSAEDKINSIADDIQKSDPSMTRESAIAKAWIDHPEIVAEYEESWRK